MAYTRFFLSVFLRCAAIGAIVHLVRYPGRWQAGPDAVTGYVFVFLAAMLWSASEDKECV